MASTKAILLEYIKNHGKVGDIVDIKKGFFRYLSKLNKAIPATKFNIEKLAAEKHKWEEENLNRKAIAETHAKLIQDLSPLTITKEAGDKDNLYGSVSVNDIYLAIKSAGIDINKTSIELSNPIKTVGDYIVPIELHQDVVVSLEVKIVKAINIHH